MTDFDPDEIAEIEARLKRVEAEEQTTLCLYLEMPYDSASHIVLQHKKWQAGDDMMAFFDVLKFMDGLVTSLSDTLNDVGMSPDDNA